jgi:hypothetical protein
MTLRSQEDHAVVAVLGRRASPLSADEDHWTPIVRVAKDNWSIRGMFEHLVGMIDN